MLAAVRQSAAAAAAGGIAAGRNRPPPAAPDTDRTVRGRRVARQQSGARRHVRLRGRRSSKRSRRRPTRQQACDPCRFYVLRVNIAVLNVLYRHSLSPFYVAATTRLASSSCRLNIITDTRRLTLIVKHAIRPSTIEQNWLHGLKRSVLFIFRNEKVITQQILLISNKQKNAKQYFSNIAPANRQLYADWLAVR